jgi:hypothetical protein
MIVYEYSEVNRLDRPHKYMYTSYQGSNFLDAYFSDRLKHLKSFQQIKGGKYKNKVDLFLHSRAAIVLKNFLDREFSDEFDELLKAIIDWKISIKLDGSLVDNVDGNIIDLSSFNISSEVNSENLLVSLLSSQLNEGNESLIKFWLDLLVQRFEVTKKLYESYPVNFRKGEGRNDIVRIYWLFALSLSLFYCVTKSIKYLSTLLKVTDLLCSLEENPLNKNIPPQGLSLILLVELLGVKLLSKTIEEVDFEYA